MNKDDKLFELLKQLQSHLEHFEDFQLTNLRNEVDRIIMIKASEEFIRDFGIG